MACHKDCRRGPGHELPGDLRRNYAIGVYNGAAFQFAEAMIDAPVVLTWFVSQLTTSNLLIGLVVPLGRALWSLPQMFVSPPIQRLKYKLPAYGLVSGVRMLMWLLLAAVVWSAPPPEVLLVAFFILYGVARLASAPAGLTFMDIVGKTIPAHRRGRFFAWRQLVGGAAGLAGGWLVKAILDSPTFAFPRGHALLFMLYGVVLATGNGAFLFVKEPASKISATPSTLREQFRRGWSFLAQDLTYRRYVLAQMLLQLAGIALPFYAVYAKSVLNAPEGMVGIYVFVRVGALLFSNLIWGPLSDRRGNRLVMMTLCAGQVLTQALALCLVILLGIWQPTGNWMPYLAFPLFFMSGALQPAQIIVGGNFLMELVSEAERALYLGLFNTLLGVVILVSGLGGIVVDHLGFAGVFGLAMGFGLLAYVLTARLPEPREALAVDARPPDSGSDVGDGLVAGWLESHGSPETADEQRG